ncbi:dephospho-CoA kinase [soil metagenome]
MTLRIGLTGPIGCGKSTVAGWLAEAGGVVVDADRLARQVTAPGEPALGQIRERFGQQVFASDGSLDRAVLAKTVFADGGSLRDLERIVHPAVRERLVAEVAAADAVGAPFVVIEAIKLVEGGYAAECDEVWLVECSVETQRARLLGRGMSADDIERRLATQGSDLVNRLGQAATHRVVTDGDIKVVRAEVQRMMERLREYPPAGASTDGAAEA